MADNITSFGFPKLDLSGVPNVYEASSAPMHGYAEAIRKRKILQRIERMNRTRAILQASGLNASDALVDAADVWASLNFSKSWEL